MTAITLIEPGAVSAANPDNAARAADTREAHTARMGGNGLHTPSTQQSRRGVRPREL